MRKNGVTEDTGILQKVELFRSLFRYIGERVFKSVLDKHEEQNEESESLDLFDRASRGVGKRSRLPDGWQCRQATSGRQTDSGQAASCSS